MQSRDVRGIKRTCQNEACALPFYDLNKVSFDCPNCGGAFDVEADLLAREAVRYVPGVAFDKKRWAKPAVTVVKKSEPDEEEDDEIDEAEDIADDGDDGDDDAAIAGAPDILLEEDGDVDEAAAPLPKRASDDGES